MLLENKTAIVYGAAGAIGSAVARAYAREGAHVHLAGRTAHSLERVAETIRAAGGSAYVAQVDVLGQTALHATRQTSSPPKAESTSASTRPRTTTSKAGPSSTCASTSSCNP